MPLSRYGTAVVDRKTTVVDGCCVAQKRRKVIKPNEGFRQQLVLYEGFMRAR